MPDVIKYLKAFNRKERFILLNEALGEDTFCLSPKFARALRCLIDCNIKIPSNAFVAMDYHLNWIQMALYLADNPSCAKSDSRIPQQNLFCNNQQDVDLLVAFDCREKTHLVMIEAKADTGWTNKQLERKKERLTLIFDKNNYGLGKVKPHFILMSPKESEGIRTKDWPAWMKPDKGKPLWLELPLPPGLIRTTRSDNRGKTNKNGGYLRVDQVSDNCDHADT